MQTALRVIYPARCIGCGGIVESDFGLCGPCYADTPFLLGLVCDGCGAELPGGHESEMARCDSCLAHPPPWDQGRAVMEYAAMGRRLVLGLKHADRLEITAPAAAWMASSARPMLRPGTVIAPIPLHWARRIGRGYNQSAELSRRLVKELRARDPAQEVLDQPDLLLRSRKTPSLEGKTRAQRYALLSAAIRVNPARAAGLKGRPVLLVDDVMTSGATFSAATAACRAAGSGPVSVLALARADKAL